MKKRSLLVAIACGMQACTSLTPAPTSPTASPALPSDGNAAAADTNAARSPGAAAAGAASVMLAEAQRQRAAGALPAAESTIERALRIEPNDPWLWIELGEIKLQTGEAQQAATMGRKALTLAEGDRELERRANRLIGTR